MDKNSNKNSAIDDLIVKYLNRKIDQDEMAELRSWISKKEENQRYFVETQYLWNHAGIKNKPDVNTSFQHFKTRLQKDQPLKARSGLVRFYPILRYAAILLIVFCLGGLSFYFLNQRADKGSGQKYSIYVPYGAKTRIILPDKSIVWLNAGSTLSYSKNFGQKNRNVELSGEGCFEIVHNSTKPFEVHTSQATITDLGTKFDVQAYPDDKDLSVTLLKGSVDVKTVYEPHKVFMLKPNQSAVIDKEQKNVAVKNVTACDAAAWTKGKIVFNEVYFGKIIRRLERDYNVKIIVKNPKLDKLRFIGDFRNAQTIGEILNIMTANNDFHYKREANVITVY